MENALPKKKPLSNRVKSFSNENDSSTAGIKSDPDKLYERIVPIPEVKIFAVKRSLEITSQESRESKAKRKVVKRANVSKSKKTKSAKKIGKVKVASKTAKRKKTSGGK